LLELLDLVRDELEQELELRGHDLQQLLQVQELLLLKHLHLLELLGHDLQHLRDLLQRRHCADSIRHAAEVAADERIRQDRAIRLLRKCLPAKSLTCVRGEPPGVLRQWIRCSDSKPGSCKLTHLTSSVFGWDHRSSSGGSSVV